MVKSSAGSEWYVFDANGRHTETLTGLLGARVYAFGYDAAGRLVSITDAAGLVTLIRRGLNGSPLSIEAPFGHITQLALNSTGFLISVTDPAGKVTAMTYKDLRGLLASFQPPGVSPTLFTYDASGLLVRDLNPTGRFLAFTRQLDTAGTTTVTQSSRLGLRMSMNGTFGEGVQNIQVVQPAGEVITRDSSYEAKQTSLANGLGTRTTILTSDPRVAVGHALLSEQSLSPSSVVNRLANYSESYELTNATDPFSVIAASFGVTLNGLHTSAAFDRASRRYTITTPTGRHASLNIDALERPIQFQWAAQSPISFFYNAAGRVSKIAEAGRSIQYLYDGQGNLSQKIDPLGRTTVYAYDLVGRVTRITLPDSRVINLLYNFRGLLTGITPPARARTTQSYNAFDNLTQFTPPALSAVPNPQTSFTYDLNQRLSYFNLVAPECAFLGQDGNIHGWTP